MSNTQSNSNQSVIELNNIDLTLPDQRKIFSDLTVFFNHQKQGLIGRNGIGKSLITQLIKNFKHTSSVYEVKGSVTLHANNIGYFQQKFDTNYNKETNIKNDSLYKIADFLDIADVLNALKSIEQGQVDESLFETVQDQWNLKAEMELKLEQANLPADVDFLVKNLSGGQKTKLNLLKLFSAKHDFLILDEPSNHLDVKSKNWLIDLIKQYKHGILLISHDRNLLREVDCIYQLTSNGIEQFGGNYDFYFEQNEINVNALNNQVNHLQKEMKLQKKLQQQNLEKSEHSQKTGIKNKRTRSHSKMAFDDKKENAQNTNKKRIQHSAELNADLNDKLNGVKDQISQYDTQKLVLDDQVTNGKQVLFIEDLMLPYVDKSVNLALNNNEKLLISGENGSGKSTLLKLIMQSETNNIKEIHFNKKIVMLDQYFSLLEQDLSALDNLYKWLPDQTEDKLRILLANIGLRRERVFLHCKDLSGGEQLKLAWLCVAGQKDCLLLLDEPDNHLDIESKNILQTCLKEYNSCFILVSHDEDFISDIGISKVIEL